VREPLVAGSDERGDLLHEAGLREYDIGPIFTPISSNGQAGGSGG
jgi:hypothetical protein